MSLARQATIKHPRTDYILRCAKQGIKIVSRYFEDLAKFKYLGTIPTDQNYIHEVIKSRLNSGNASDRSQFLLIHKYH
jgi:hypothetical protein